MPKNTSEIVVGANGTVRVATNLATAEPADITVAFAAGWVDLGYTSEDGVALKDSKSIVDIKVWQLFYAARKIIADRAFTAAFVLRQFSGPQVEVAFGGATVTQDGGAGKYKLTPPAPEALAVVKFAVEWLDGTHKYRWIIPACIVQDDVETKVMRTAAADLPVTLGAVGSDTALPWYAQTDDPSWVNAT